MIEFAIVKSSDIKEFAKLTSEIWHEYWTCILSDEQIDYMVDKFQSENAIINQINNENYTYFYIMYNSEIAGYIGLSSKKDWLFLSKLYLKKEYRHKGIGTKAFDFIKQFALKNGYNKIRLTVNKYNKNTINVYNKWNFKTVESIVTDIGNNFVMDDYIMEYVISEKEKMLKGGLYLPEDDEVLSNERIKCKTLCYQFNSLSSEKTDERKELIKKIIGKTGNKFWIEQPFICDYGYNIEIGENFYSNHNLTILDCAKVTFGDNVFIGPNCSFYTAEHPINYRIRNKGFEYAEPITIGNNVWIGGSVTVLSGITIGNNAVIGAGSVVAKDIPNNVVIAGNPAKIIKYLDAEKFKDKE